MNKNKGLFSWHHEGENCDYCNKSFKCTDMSMCPECGVLLHSFLCWEKHMKLKHVYEITQVANDYEYDMFYMNRY